MAKHGKATYLQIRQLVDFAYKKGRLDERIEVMDLDPNALLLKEQLAEIQEEGRRLDNSIRGFLSDEDVNLLLKAPRPAFLK